MQSHYKASCWGFVEISYLRFWSIACVCFSSGALPSPADLTDVGECRTRKATSQQKTPSESKCLCMCSCMIIISKAYLSARRCAGGVCVCMCMTVQCAYFKVYSGVRPLVIVASHVDKSEPHCVQRLVLKYIMDLNHRDFWDFVCLCVTAQTLNSDSARQASLREKCIMDVTTSSICRWSWGKAFR